MIKQLTIILTGLLFPIQTLIAQNSCSSAIPFDNCIIDTTLNLFPENTEGDIVINNVPNYHWYHGCGPTALGNVIGFYDGIGFSDLVEGDASTQTEGANNAIATSGHYNDYSQPIDNSPNLLQDKSELGGAHSSNCLADFMNTSWSSRNLYYGWSWNNDIINSFNGYVNYINNNYHRTTARYNFSIDVAWEIYKNEIDNNRPVVLLVDSDGNGGTDHFVTGIGYNNTTKKYAVYDTWYTPVR